MKTRRCSGAHRGPGSRRGGPGPIALVAGPVVHRASRWRRRIRASRCTLATIEAAEICGTRSSPPPGSGRGGGIDPEPSVAAVAVRRDLGDQAAKHFHVCPAQSVAVDVGGGDLRDRTGEGPAVDLLRHHLPLVCCQLLGISQPRVAEAARQHHRGSHKWSGKGSRPPRPCRRVGNLASPHAEGRRDIGREPEAGHGASLRTPGAPEPGRRGARIGSVGYLRRGCAALTAVGGPSATASNAGRGPALARVTRRPGQRPCGCPRRSGTRRSARRPHQGASRHRHRADAPAPSIGEADPRANRDSVARDSRHRADVRKQSLQ